MKKLRVLFIGNSHTYFGDMPQVFKELAEAGQAVEVEATLQGQGGVTYAWHLASAEFRYGLLHGNYDYLFMQQAAHSPCPTRAETLRDGARIIALSKACGVEPIVVVPWAEKRFPEHQANMVDTFVGLARQCDVRLSPVGYVFERVLRERPDIDLFWYDGEHASPYGSYVVAAMAYAVLFGASPVGLPGEAIRHIGGEAADMAEVQARMDQLAKKTGGLDTAAMAEPQHKAAMEAVQAMWAQRFPPMWDRKAMRMTLDPDLCHTLQTFVWEAYTEHGL